MDLANRDLKINQLHKKLADCKKNMRRGSESLTLNCKQNVFLKDIADEYTTHFYNIKKIKTKQCEALEKLSNYISNHSDTLSDSEHTIKQSRQHQKEIMAEISSIRRQLQCKE